jgi:Na+/pantothenate symporter
MLGAMITVGALYVGGFGGAFEANKLFTGLFAIPMTIPLILGIVLKKPQPWGALATVVVGIITGLILNAQPQISWELGTLIEILICITVFLVSGLFQSKSPVYHKNVSTLFKKLATPLTEAEKPVENWGFQREMNKLYAVALLVTGVLFIVMSIPSIRNTSGMSSMIAGIICLVLSAVMLFINRKTVTNTALKSQPPGKKLEAV